MLPYATMLFVVYVLWSSEASCDRWSEEIPFEQIAIFLDVLARTFPCCAVFLGHNLGPSRCAWGKRCKRWWRRCLSMEIIRKLPGIETWNPKKSGIAAFAWPRVCGDWLWIITRQELSTILRYLTILRDCIGFLGPHGDFVGVPVSAVEPCWTWKFGCPFRLRDLTGLAGLRFQHDLYSRNAKGFSGWWFGTWILFSHILGLLIMPIDVHIFQRGGLPPPTSSGLVVRVVWEAFVWEAFAHVLWHLSRMMGGSTKKSKGEKSGAPWAAMTCWGCRILRMGNIEWMP